MKYVLSFSGGKDSTALLFYLLENKMPLDKVVFVNTTKEHPELERQARKILSGIQCETREVRLQFDYYFSDHILTKGKYKGQKGYGWPGARRRWCTRLKINAIKSVTSPDDVQYVGIAADEADRTLKNTGRGTKLYPLVEAGITGDMALQMCYDRGYDWEGLYEEFPRSGCYCCPLQRVGSLKKLFLTRPKLWAEMLEMDKNSPFKFEKTRTLNDFDERFKIEICNNKQPTI